MKPQYHYRDDKGVWEQTCKHGVGHEMGTHGCDGCCATMDLKSLSQRQVPKTKISEAIKALQSIQKEEKLRKPTQDWEKEFDEIWIQMMKRGIGLGGARITKKELIFFISQHFIPKEELVEKLEEMKREVNYQKVGLNIGETPDQLFARISQNKIFNDGIDTAIALIKGEEK